MTDKDYEIPVQQQNGTSPSAVHVSGVKSPESSAAAPPNGVRLSVLVVCPEMCCYCFDVLIAHLTNNHHGARNPFLKFFKNDE